MTEDIKSLKRRIMDLESMFCHPFEKRHYRAENGKMVLSDRCGSCGFDENDNIHLTY